MLDKVTPQAVEIESAVLGCMMQFNECLLSGLNILSLDSFYKPENKKIYEAITSLNKQSNKVDMLTVVQQLQKNGDLLSVGGPLYVSKLNSGVSSSGSFETHCYILTEKDISRKQIAFAQELLNKAQDQTNDPIEVNNYLNDEAYKLIGLSNMSKESTNTELLEIVVEQIRKAKEAKGLTGVDSGYNELNSITGGLQSTELIILAARPAMGKTALALCLGRNAAFKDKRVLVFSLEMGAEQLMKRCLSIDSGVSGEKLKTGELSQDDWQNVNHSIAALDTDNIKIIDDVFHLNGIVNKAKMERLKNGVDFIIIDYLQLIDNKKKGGSREQEISEASRKLKLLAKDLNVPILALSQLSRAVETRGGDKRPMLSDLRESGAIEQDADIVMFLYRAQYYGFIEDEHGNSTEGKAELIVAKNRSGSLANIELDFIHNCTRFDDPNKITFVSEGMKPNLEF